MSFSLKPRCPTSFGPKLVLLLHPGPGGSGAIVVRMGTSIAGPMAVWVGSMSFAGKSTTNNVAENMGLLVGLKACDSNRYEPLHVIGDSAMIIRQQRTRKPPKAAHLKHIYWRIRRAADKLNIIQWHHHLRDFNKMADKLANKAMDTRRSCQVHIDGKPTELHKWDSVLRHLGRDVAHWQTNQEGAMQDGVVDNSP